MLDDVHRSNRKEEEGQKTKAKLFVRRRLATDGNSMKSESGRMPLTTLLSLGFFLEKRRETLALHSTHFAALRESSRGTTRFKYASCPQHVSNFEALCDESRRKEHVEKKTCPTWAVSDAAFQLYLGECAEAIEGRSLSGARERSRTRQQTPLRTDDAAIVSEGVGTHRIVWRSNNLMDI